MPMIWLCRTPPGVRELKLIYILILSDNRRRTPPGVRELKRDISELHTTGDKSHPSRGA